MKKGITDLLMPSGERKTRLKAIKNASLTIAEKAQLSILTNKSVQTIDRYINENGSNYEVEVTIIFHGESIIKTRKN